MTMAHIHFPSLLAFCYILLLPSLSANRNALDCTNAKKEWLTLRYTSTALLAGGNAMPNFPQNMEVCPMETKSSTETSATAHPPSCCDRMMEHEMLMLSNLQIMQQARLQWLQVASQMKNNSADLQDFFRSDLQQSKDRLNQFFSRIYGYNYKMHRNFFFAFFDDLEGYMAGQKGKLGPLVDNFFNQLRDSIVSLIERSNQPISSAGSVLTPTQSGSVLGASPGGAGATDEVTEARRIRCLSERVAQHQPFGGVDVLVRTRLLEAYPPARTLVNVLEVTSRLLVDVVHQVTSSPTCSLAIARSQFCAVCAGRPIADTCPDTCRQLVSDCLRLEGGETAQLSVVWSRLIDSVVSIMARLERAFNFPAVNRHLQMHISEAITNLQSRYAENKSKYQSECRLPGVGSHSLFPSGSRQQQQLQQPASSTNAFPATPSASSWPSASTHTRWPPALSPGDYRYRPRRSPQDFRDWHYQQGRQQPGNPTFADQPAVPGMGSNYALARGGHAAPGGLGAGGYLPGAGHQPPASSSSSFPGLAGNNGLGEVNSGGMATSTDSQEGLIRWAAQLKNRYTALGSLFASADGGLCPPALTRQQQPNNNSTTECWSPPVPVSPVNTGLSVIAKQLSEAAERLQASASSSGDPEPLRIMPSQGMPFSLDPTGSQQMGGPFDWSAGQPPQQQFLGNQYQQWPPSQGQPGLAYGSTFETAPVQAYGQANAPFMGGSGMEPSTLFGGDGLGYPPMGRQPEPYGGQNQMAPQLHTNYQQPPPEPHPAYSPDLGLGSGQLPPQGTYYSQAPTPEWDRGNSNNPDWRMQPVAPEWPSPTLAPSPPVSVPQVEKTNGSMPNQTVTLGPTESHTGQVVNTSHVQNTTAAVPEKLPVVTTPASTQSNVEKNLTAPSTPPSIQTHLETPGSVGEHQAGVTSLSQTNLPDDEDNIVPPVDVHTPIPEAPVPPENQPHPPSSWAEENAPRWNEALPSSGFLPPASTPDLPGYGWNHQFGAPQPDQFLTPRQHGTETPGAFLPQPTPPDTSPPPVYPPHPWGTPDVGGTHPDQTLHGGWMPQPPESSGQLPNQWYPPNEPAPGTYPQWPHSGTFDTGRTPLPDEESQERTMKTTHQPPTEPAPQLPSFVPPPAVLPNAPMPPPEVWVPAKITPGQSGPSILLVREYNVQGPYYGSETAPRTEGVCCRFTIVSFLVTHIISAIMFYPLI